MPALITLLPYIIKTALWIAGLTAAVYYYASSITGGSAGQSLNEFMTSIGVGSDISAANGCVLCPYIEQFIGAIDIAATGLYFAIVDYLWILIVLGFGIFALTSAMKLLKESMDSSLSADATAERKFEFAKWVEGLWKQGVRILFVGTFLGVIGFAGINAPRILSEITIKPIMSMGTYISMGVANIPDSFCPYETETQPTETIISSDTLRPLMCMTGLVNAVSLAGVSGGFNLMTESASGEEYIMWLLGLALVLTFAFYGLKLFFELLNIVFTLLFFIMFAPIIIASYAFSNVWAPLKNVGDNVLNQTASLAVMMVAISLKLTIFLSIIVFAAGKYGFANLFPADIAGNAPASDAALNADPTGFLMTLLFVFLFYYYVVEKRLTKKFANANTNLFMDFGSKLESTLSGGINWIIKSAGQIGKIIAGGK